MVAPTGSIYAHGVKAVGKVRSGKEYGGKRQKAVEP